MTSTSAPAGDGAHDSGAGADDDARRRRERVFGEVLPDTTADERGPEDAEAGGGGNDEWLRSNVPPHHG